MDELDTLAPDRGGRGTQGRAQEYDLGTLAASKLVVGNSADFHGWAIAEATGAGPARVRIRDGRDATGAVLAPIALLSGTSSAEWLGEHGVTAETGIFVEVVSGSVEVVLYLLAPALRARP